MRRTLAIVLSAVAGFLAACSSGKNHPKPAGTVPPPQPTTSSKTGTPSTPSNTNRTTTHAGGG